MLSLNEKRTILEENDIMKNDLDIVMERIVNNFPEDVPEENEIYVRNFVSMCYLTIMFKTEDIEVEKKFVLEVFNEHPELPLLQNFIKSYNDKQNLIDFFLDSCRIVAEERRKELDAINWEIKKEEKKEIKEEKNEIKKITFWDKVIETIKIWTNK